MLSDVYARATNLIAALDASFMNKSGKLTDGLSMFWRGCTSHTEFGLELSLLCLVDLLSNTTFALKAFQTIDEKGKSRIDLYAKQVTDLTHKFISMGLLISSLTSIISRMNLFPQLPQQEFRSLVS